MATEEHTPPITSVKVQDGRLVRITYADGVTAVADVTPLLHGPIFSAVRTDESLFAQATVDELGALMWPDDSAIAPETLRELVLSRCVV
ncbi:MAG: DUF2442 domain-containing protein [Cellulomonadaceae bacterium]|jgi:hypothetical protein|nr:DUF2442 domain-containing protein [Cellulomonadaceae bacterium]